MASGFIGLASASLCLVQKVPQIFSLFKAGTSRGISLPSVALELWSYSTTLCYSLGSSISFTSYCEYPGLVLQDVVLLFFVLHHRHLLGPSSISLFLLFVAFQTSMALGTIPSWAMALVVSGSIPVSATSKVLQLAQILKQKDSGEVSAVTWFIGAVTSAARLYTFTMDTWSGPLAFNMLVSTILNIAVCAAAVAYKGTSENTKGKNKTS